MTTVQLLGCDGSTWNLMGMGASPAKLSDGIGGLHLPKVTHLWSTTARQSGAQWRGARMTTRQFSLNVAILNPDDAAGFFSALAHDATARLVVNGSRTLTVRLDEDNDFVPVKDPALGVDCVYPVHLVADRPEWAGPQVTASFPYVAAASSNFFGGGSGTLGPPFTISASSLFNTASISNPGDLPAYPVWTIQGPLTTATVGVGSNLINIPFPLQATDTVVIDAAAQSIRDSAGNNLWPQMGYTQVGFSPVPGGGVVPIAVGMTGGSAGARITVSLVPLYRRAW